MRSVCFFRRAKSMFSIRHWRTISRAAFSGMMPRRASAGERGLEIETIGGPRLVGKNLPHLRRAEDVAEDDGIERRRGHAFSLRRIGQRQRILQSGDLAPAREAVEMREHLLDMHDV